MNSFTEDREEAVEDRMPVFRVQVLGELHAPLHVGEKHRHLLALTFEGGLGPEDLLGKMVRRVGSWRRVWPRAAVSSSGHCDGRPALHAELRADGQLAPATLALHPERRSTFQAELRELWILVAAGETFHGIFRVTGLHLAMF